MKYLKSSILSCLVMGKALAGITPFEYKLGMVRVSEGGSALTLHVKPKIIVSILPGGKTWPILALDENGIIYAGNAVIDSLTGRMKSNPEKLLGLPQNAWISEKNSDFQIQQGNRTCIFSLQQLGLDKRRTPRSALKNANILFSNNATTFLALVTQFGQDGKTANYRVEKIDTDTCKVANQVNLGNPDLLVELSHSAKGGWWMTGTIEQTLLQSSDGTHWVKAALPAGLSGLVSAYVANAREIWLAASLPTEEPQSPYLLVYSEDGGRSWRNVVMDDPALRRLPRGWLEGQKRLSQ
jgi:hypothetical protein